MKITDKTKLLRALITAPTKELILEFNNCYLNIYCCGSTTFTKVETIQVATENKFNGYLVTDKNSELVNILKDCCSKKSSEIQFKVDLNNNSYLYYKRTNKEELTVLEINNLNTKCPNKLVHYLDIINKQEFINERLLSHKEYTTKTETKYEYEVIEINDNVLISNKDLELVPKVFDVEHNKLVTLKPEFDITNLKKKELDAIKSNLDNVVISYEDLVFSDSEDVIQVTNVEADVYYYCKRCFKLND